MTNPTQNVRALARLYLEWWDGPSPEGLACREDRAASFAAFLARRGVLAVCAKTVPLTMREPEPGQYHEWPDFRAYLRAMARGKP